MATIKVSEDEYKALVNKSPFRQKLTGTLKGRVTLPEKKDSSKILRELDEQYQKLQETPNEEEIE